MISKRSNTASAKGRDALCVPVQKVMDMEEVSDNGRVASDRALVNQAAPRLDAPRFDPSRETQEQRARRLFDEMARNIGREAVNRLKLMYPHMLSEQARASKIWETSLVNTIRNDINWRMRPLLMAMIAMHNEWETEHAE